ncbi:MAG TPA: HAMP domain-containing sensor histidine kinase [Coleofasciculaceae cyanobacterium]
MRLPKWLLKATGNISAQMDIRSLRIRLTVGIASVCALGLGGVAIWTSWKMQSLLVITHKQNIQYIADRFEHDVEIYSEMEAGEEAIQKAIDNLTTGNTVLVVRRLDGTIAAQSAALKVGDRNRSLLFLTQGMFQSQLSQVQGRYWVACGNSLQVNNQKVGTFYVAQDITSDQIMFLSLVRTLGIASVLSIGAIIVIIAVYVQRSLQPLQRMSQLTERVSADDLDELQINLDDAPSEVKELAQTFNQMLARLRDAWEQQREFVSNISHELRTPLTVVSGYLQSTLRRGNNLTEPQREALEIAVSEADRTIQLLQSLLDLVRADSGQMLFNIDTFVLNELVADVAEMARKSSNQAIAIECTDSTIQVKADRDRLKQVLLNLIDNAVKYSNPNEPVTLKFNQVGEQVTLQVCDRGVGIPLQQQPRIFERFYRVDEARTRSTGGYGLGLSIVKTLVEGMGGSISVHSKLGEGSVFTVILPISVSKSSK